MACFSRSYATIDDQINFALSQAKKLKMCKVGNKVVTVHGTNEDAGDETNIMKILNVE